MNIRPLLAISQSAYPQPAGGRGGVPKIAPEQTAALTQMNADLATQTQLLAAARAAVLTAALAAPRTDAAIQSRMAAVKDAELAIATARASAFAKIQATPAKFSAAQITAVAANGGGPGRGGGRGAAVRAPGPTTTTGGAAGGSVSMPHVTIAQANALTQVTAGLSQTTQALTARAAVVTASLADPRDDAAIRLKVEAVAAAELTMAMARADALSRKFWRAEGGAIVGESTAANPSGNTYIAYRDVAPKDFTLKFEIKVEGDGGSGLQYRSKSGIPWTRAIPANVTANVGPVNLNWMLTGPQADFWPSRIYTGQFYSENMPMGIMAWRGQVVEGAGMGAKRLMDTIGDRVGLGKVVKVNDWNEYTIIARGGTFIQIVNGQLMSVMVDDDPDSSNVRNIWLKKLN